MNSWVTRFFSRPGNTARKAVNSPSTRPKQKYSLPKGRQANAAQFPYRGVRIYNRSQSCCKAGKRIAGQKFLAAHAPQLPLGGCDHPEACQCRYQHLDDRRQEMRRDSDHGLPGRPYNEVDRRYRADRRRR